MLSQALRLSRNVGRRNFVSMSRVSRSNMGGHSWMNDSMYESPFTTSNMLMIGLALSPAVYVAVRGYQADYYSQPKEQIITNKFKHVQSWRNDYEPDVHISDRKGNLDHSKTKYEALYDIAKNRRNDEVAYMPAPVLERKNSYKKHKSVIFKKEKSISKESSIDDILSL